jgi:hypothetical protein
MPPRIKYSNHGSDGYSVDGTNSQPPSRAVLDLAEIFQCICEVARSPNDREYSVVEKAIRGAETDSELPPEQARKETIETIREMYRSAESDGRTFDYLRQQAEAGVVRSLKHRQILLTIASKFFPELYREIAAGQWDKDDWRDISTSHLELHTIDGVSLRMANDIRQRFPKVGMIEEHRKKFGLKTLPRIGESTAKRIERRLQERIAGWCENYQFVEYDYMAMAELLLSGKDGHSNSWSGL